jgi:hypothetical protein
MPIKGGRDFDRDVRMRRARLLGEHGQIALQVQA